MPTLVYRFGCRIATKMDPRDMSPQEREEMKRHVASETQRIFGEMERGRSYYNQMVGFVNDHLAGKRGEDGKRTGGLAERACVLMERFAAHRTPEERKRLKASAIYWAIKRLALRARREFPPGASGCYKGTYDDVCADFERAMSDKRKGVWPGTPFRFRGPRETAACVRFPSGVTWADLQFGRPICHAGIYRRRGNAQDDKYFFLTLRLTKEGEPVKLICDLGNKCRGVRRTIPEDAKVAKIRVLTKGDYGTRHKFEVQVTFRTDGEEATRDISERIGIDIGWELQPDGSIAVARTSDGRELTLAQATVAQALRVDELQSQRCANANLLAEEAEKAGEKCLARSPESIVAWVERRMMDLGRWDWIAAHRWQFEREHSLRCTQAHCRRRYQAIRDDQYRKFASANGQVAAIVKLPRKKEAEGESLGTEPNHCRQIASTFKLSQLLRNRGALEVVCERPVDSLGPRAENADQIKEAAGKNLILSRPARRQVRKYRKRKASPGEGAHAMEKAL